MEAPKVFVRSPIHSFEFGGSQVAALEALASSSSTPAPMPFSEMPSRNNSSISLGAFGLTGPASAQSVEDENFCHSCLASRKELDYFKSLIDHLQKKLANLEENHEHTKKEYNTVSSILI